MAKIIDRGWAKPDDPIYTGGFVVGSVRLNPTRDPQSPARYPLLEVLKHGGIPVTRENYLKLAFPDGAPDPLPAELELELPLQLRAR